MPRLLVRLAERKAYLRTEGYTEKEQDKASEAKAAGEHWREIYDMCNDAMLHI